MKYSLFLAATFFIACEKKRVIDADQKVIIKTADIQKIDQQTVQLHTDTLQFIYFEDDSDYWAAVFLDAKKDTLVLVTDSVITDNYKDNLFKVEWFVDTLHEAGNDTRYAAKRMTQFRVIDGKPFVKNSEN